MIIPYPCDKCESQGIYTTHCLKYYRCDKWLDWAQEVIRIAEGTPRTPDQADDISVQPSAVTAVGILKLIRSHNLTVETIDRIGG